MEANNFFLLFPHRSHEQMARLQDFAIFLSISCMIFQNKLLSSMFVSVNFSSLGDMFLCFKRYFWNKITVDMYFITEQLQLFQLRIIFSLQNWYFIGFNLRSFWLPKFDHKVDQNRLSMHSYLHVFKTNGLSCKILVEKFASRFILLEDYSQLTRIIISDFPKFCFEPSKDNISNR